MPEIPSSGARSVQNHRQAAALSTMDIASTPQENIMADLEHATPRSTEAGAKLEQAADAVSEKLHHTAGTAAQGIRDTQEAVGFSLAQATELARAYAEVQREALETVVAAGKIYSEGLQHLAAKAAGTGKTQFDESIAHLRALAGVKSIHEAVTLQTEYARNATSRALDEGSLLMEEGLKLAQETLAPMAARAREAAAKVKPVM
jgi:phasin family protein